MVWSVNANCETVGENRMRFAVLIAIFLAACSSEVTREPVAVAAADVTEPQFTSIEEIEDSALRKDVPYVPTPQETVDEMLRLARVSRNDVVYDLGSGDGRIVISAARKHGARGVGIDIDPVRIQEANENARKAGVTDRVRFVQGDLFETDLREATAVTLYLLRSVNLRLRPKLLAELRPGTPVVSHDFDMAEWRPDQHVRVGDDDIYLWIVPAKIDGTWTWPAADGRLMTGKIAQEFQKFSGVATLGEERFFIRNGLVNGNDVSFDLTTSDSDTAPAVEKYAGRLSAGKLDVRRVGT
jgi:SAM-dependent methyltransferase